MPLDPYLLATARAAGRTLQGAERAIEPLRQDYRACIRALNAGGASLREIAAALGLSHQRVHQLVRGEARPAGRPAPTDVAAVPAGAEKACVLCGGADGNVTGHSPVCASCRKAGRTLLAGEGLEDDRGLRLARGHQRPQCLGCGRQPEAGETFVAGAGGAVCPECL